MTQTQPGGRRHEIFVSYAHENKDWIKALGLDQIPDTTESARFWLDENRVHPGGSWTSEARLALRRATAAVLLISRAFLDSRPIIEYEAPQIMRRYRGGEICLIFVPVGQVSTEEIEAKLRLRVNNIISVPSWESPLPAEAEPRSEIREQIISAATEPGEVQNLRRSIAAHYDLRKRIGQGHFSTLFTAVDRQLNREVVVKLLSSTDRADHFRSAITKVAHASDHTNALSIYAAYLDSEPPHYIVRYVKGRPLNAILNDLPHGKVGVDFVKQFIATIGSATSYAHMRDAKDLNIKPCNIIVADHTDRLKRNFFLNINSYDENSFLVDESWCKNRDDILYMPLERRRRIPYWGDPQKSDQYRLGVVAYEMLVGAKRFRQLAEPLRQRDFSAENWRWPALATECDICTSHISEVVDRMVSTHPEHRYDDIDQAIAGVAISELSVETVRDSYRRLMASEHSQTEFFRSFYDRFFTSFPDAVRYFKKRKFGCLKEDCEASRGWQRQFQALKEAVLLLIVFRAFREEGREPNILTRIVEEHCKRKIPAWSYEIFRDVLIGLVLEKDPEARFKREELQLAWSTVVQPGIDYMRRKTEEIERRSLTRVSLGRVGTGPDAIAPPGA